MSLFSKTLSLENMNCFLLNMFFKALRLNVFLDNN
jgi:hypothetical protein